ncbi:MAG: hypothetical protein ACREJN_13840 [Nitrospiraceae bacterium]
MEQKIEWLEVRTTTDGAIELIQGDRFQKSHAVRIIPDQVEVLIQWLKADRSELKGHERGQRQLKPLKRSILQSLKAHGPHRYEDLSALFDEHRTAVMQPVVQDLVQEQYIQWQADDRKVVEITESGLSLLEDREFG